MEDPWVFDLPAKVNQAVEVGLAANEEVTFGVGAAFPLEMTEASAQDLAAWGQVLATFVADLAAERSVDAASVQVGTDCFAAG